MQMTTVIFQKQKEILKEEFGMKHSRTDEVYIALLEKKAFNPKTAVKIKMNSVIEKALKLGHLKQTKNNKVYLTKIGRIIAKGAKELFLEG